MSQKENPRTRYTVPAADIDRRHCSSADNKRGFGGSMLPDGLADEGLHPVFRRRDFGDPGRQVADLGSQNRLKITRTDVMDLSRIATPICHHLALPSIRELENITLLRHRKLDDDILLLHCLIFGSRRTDEPYREKSREY